MSTAAASAFDDSLLSILRRVAEAQSLGCWYGMDLSEVVQVLRLEKAGLIFRHPNGPLATFRTTETGTALQASLPGEPGPGQYLIIADYWELVGAARARDMARTTSFLVHGEGLRHAEEVAEAALLDTGFLAQLFPEPNHPIRRHAELVAHANAPAYFTEPSHPLRQRRCWTIDTVLPLHQQPLYRPNPSARAAR
jgi:hypothetical protein